MNLRWRLKEYCQKNKRQRWDIYEEFSVWQRAHGLKSVKSGMSSHFSESRDSSYVGSAMYREFSSKERRIESFKIQIQSTPTGKRPRGRPWTRWSDYISDLAWSRLGVEPAELSKIAVDCEVYRVLLGLLPPRLSPKEKLARKWANEWECRPTFNLSIQFVCQKWMSYSNNSAYLDGNLRFCENELKVSDIEGKMVLTPWSSTTMPF